MASRWFSCLVCWLSKSHCLPNRLFVCQDKLNGTATFRVMVRTGATIPDSVCWLILANQYISLLVKMSFDHDVCSSAHPPLTYCSVNEVLIQCSYDCFIC